MASDKDTCGIESPSIRTISRSALAGLFTVYCTVRSRIRYVGYRPSLQART